MSEYLSHHPDIYMGRKEMHFFGDDLRFGPQFYRRDQDAYLTEFDAWNGQAHVGEASVWYLFSTQAAAEIKAFNPNSRIIIMLREPVEMLYSLYHQFRSDGNEQLPTFEQALDAQNDRRAGRRIARHAHFGQGLAYCDVVRYTEQVRRYIELFGCERVHVVVYDDFADKTAAVYGGVLDFLGVDSTRIKNSFPVINGNHSVKSPLFRAIMSDPLVRGTAISMHAWLPRPVFAALQKIELRLMKWNFCPQKRPPLDPEIRMSLKREFATEVERLSELLGRDLTHWNKIQSLPANHN